MTGSETAKPLTGTILEIQRMSTEDGPGLRTSVFFKGCPLKCGWCHNPESLSARPQVHWIGVSCIGCGLCVEACPRNALSLEEGKIRIDRNLCTGCGICTGECPSKSMELLGTAWKLDPLIDELIKDRTYFEQSGGGVTLSGGEAAMQFAFCLALLKGLKEKGIETALDTCGQLPRRDFEELLPDIDTLLFDLKEIDSERHRRFTGTGNEKILSNLLFTADYVRSHQRPGRIWIRTPLIPGATATAANVRGIGSFIAKSLAGAVERWELCAFNNLCRDKYARLGLQWDYAGTPLLSRKEMEAFAAVARDSGIDPSIVTWSGPTLAENPGEDNDPAEGDLGQPDSNVLAFAGKRRPAC